MCVYNLLCVCINCLPLLFWEQFKGGEGGERKRKGGFTTRTYCCNGTTRYKQVHVCTVHQLKLVPFIHSVSSVVYMWWYSGNMTMGICYDAYEKVLFLLVYIVCLLNDLLDFTPVYIQYMLALAVCFKVVFLV